MECSGKSKSMHWQEVLSEAQYSIDSAHRACQRSNVMTANIPYISIWIVESRVPNCNYCKVCELIPAGTLSYAAILMDLRHPDSPWLKTHYSFTKLPGYLHASSCFDCSDEYHKVHHAICTDLSWWSHLLAWRHIGSWSTVLSWLGLRPPSLGPRMWRVGRRGWQSHHQSSRHTGLRQWSRVGYREASPFLCCSPWFPEESKHRYTHKGPRLLYVVVLAADCIHTCILVRWQGGKGSRIICILERWQDGKGSRIISIIRTLDLFTSYRMGKGEVGNKGGGKEHFFFRRNICVRGKAPWQLYLGIQM